MKLTTWGNMTAKERNDFLGEIGGCGACSKWDTSLNYLGLENGCNLKGHNTESFQIYDNGCKYHTMMKTKPMINEQIKWDGNYYSISRKVAAQLKKEVKTGYVKRILHKYCAIDKNRTVGLYNLKPRTTLAFWNSNDLIELRILNKIAFTKNEEQFIRENWSRLLWRLK